MPSVTTLLVANRGEIARRVVRTARAMGIRTVAVFSDADAGSGHVTEADVAVRLPGVTAAETYLRADLLVEAARRGRADAVHPGYGFLSEQADFARACADAGLVFVGPSPEVIELMGSKLAAKQLMAAAGIPVLPGFEVTEATSAAALGDAAAELAWPVLVKAVFGGGGRGMRVIRDRADLVDAVASARAEAAAAFGDGTVFLERCVESPRHLEVQVFGDTHGTVTHLHERECSVQRRHQKVIEEAPAPRLDDRVRDELCAAAVRAAKAVGYVGAGTVEFVLDPDGAFWFLEMNTRLQVEHPVTELVTGLDLVALQLTVARGDPLPPEVLGVPMRGHAIEARLYAEDVAAGFLPTAGVLHRLDVPAVEGVRIDAGVASGDTVTTHYDALLAKVIAWGPDRSAAADRLAHALAGARIHGPVTNRDLLLGTLGHPEFRAGRADTTFYDRHPAAELAAATQDPTATHLHCTAAALARHAAERAALPTPAGIPAAWRNVGPAEQPMTFVAGDTTVEIGDPAAAGVLVHRAAPDHVDLEVDGVRRVVLVEWIGATCHVDSSLGHSTLQEVPRFPVPDASAAPGSLLAPMPGTVVQVIVGAGDVVEAGDLVAVLEAMKMQHTIRAPRAGTVTEVRVEAGDQVVAAAVLVVIDEVAA
jgi:acetyl/propionyl-CoA carboxylase alpha subunit